MKIKYLLILKTKKKFLISLIILKLMENIEKMTRKSKQIYF